MNITQDNAIVYINALRNGVAPTKATELISTGRSHQIVHFKNALKESTTGASSVRFVTGSTGSGKTFLCQQFKEIALSNDYVVSYFQTNQGFRLNKIEDLYYAIMHNLYVRVSDGNKVAFETLFDLWTDQMEKGQTSKEMSFEINEVCKELSKYNYTYARVFLSFMKGRLHKKPEQMNISASWLSGEGNIPYTLKEKYGLVGQVKKNDTLDFLKAFNQLVQFIGYKGLVIIIDDMELILQDRKDLRKNGYDILKHLSDLTCMGDLLGINFILSGETQWLTDSKKGITTHKALSQRLNLKLDHLKLKDSTSIYNLENLTRPNYISLTEKIVKIYSIAYDFKHTLHLPSIFLYTFETIGLSSQTDVDTRDFIIGLIEVLDTIKMHKFSHPFATEHPEAGLVFK